MCCGKKKWKTDDDGNGDGWIRKLNLNLKLRRWRLSGTEWHVQYSKVLNIVRTCSHDYCTYCTCTDKGTQKIKMEFKLNWNEWLFVMVVMWLHKIKHRDNDSDIKNVRTKQFCRALHLCFHIVLVYIKLLLSSLSLSII